MASHLKNTLLKLWKPKVHYRHCASKTENRFRKLGQIDYWDKFYAKETQADRTSFEWLADYESTKDVILSAFPKTSPIKFLDLGCGSSMLSLRCLACLKQEAQLVCLDFSQGALDLQREHHKVMERKGLFRHDQHTTFIQSRAEKLTFQDKVFDVILDKGTTDSVLKLGEEGLKLAEGILSECARVIKSRGKILQITDEDPELRIPLIEEILPGMIVSYRALDVANREIFVYTITKRPN